MPTHTLFRSRGDLPPQMRCSSGWRPGRFSVLPRRDLQPEPVHLIRHMEPVFGRLFELPPYLEIADLGGAFEALAGMGTIFVRLHLAAPN